MSMYTYGKLVDGNLVIAPKVLVTDLGTITNPTEQNYFDNGYQKVNFSDQPEFDRDNFKLEPLYIRVDNQINVSWQIIELTQEEKRQVLNNKVSLLEKQCVVGKEKLYLQKILVQVIIQKQRHKKLKI